MSSLSLSTPLATFSAYLLDTYGIENNTVPIDHAARAAKRLHACVLTMHTWY